jgi:hypothetical protein
VPLEAYAYNEIRYRMLASTDAVDARSALAAAQEDIDQRWQTYRNMAERWCAICSVHELAAGSDDSPAADSHGGCPVQKGNDDARLVGETRTTN